MEDQIKEIGIHSNAIVDRLAMIKTSNGRVKTRLLNEIHAAAEEIEELVDNALILEK